MSPKQSSPRSGQSTPPGKNALSSETSLSLQDSQGRSFPLATPCSPRRAPPLRHSGRTRPTTTSRVSRLCRCGAEGRGSPSRSDGPLSSGTALRLRHARTPRPARPESKRAAASSAAPARPQRLSPHAGSVPQLPPAPQARVRVGASGPTCFWTSASLSAMAAAVIEGRRLRPLATATGIKSGVRVTAGAASRRRPAHLLLRANRNRSSGWRHGSGSSGATDCHLVAGPWLCLPGPPAPEEGAAPPQPPTPRPCPRRQRSPSSSAEPRPAAGPRLGPAFVT